MVNDIGFSENKISVILNPVNYKKIDLEKKVNDKKIISIVGRLSGPKGDVAYDLLEILSQDELLSKYKVRLIGGKELPERFIKFKEKDIEFIGYVPNIQEKIFEVLTKIRGLEIEKEREMSTWKTTVASATLNVATRYLEQKYSENKKIVEYIGNVKRDILQNLNEFLESSHEEFEDKKRMPGIPQKENIMERYNVNIFVDNSRSETVPLVMDVDYSFENIFRKS